jgi:glycosyltransferase involved in cell wall biosynthesis
MLLIIAPIDNTPLDELMRKPVLTIFYQFDPWHPTIGGIQSLIRYFIKYAPPEFGLRCVGISGDADGPVGKWQAGELEGRELMFMPLIQVQNDDVKQRVPTSVKYTQALFGRRLESDFMHFHRLEPTLATTRWAGEKILFVHNDIHQQVAASKDKNGILWQRFPDAYFYLEHRLVKQFSQVLSCNSESMRLYRERYPDMAQRISRFKNAFDDTEFYPLEYAERQQRRMGLARRMNLAEDTQFILFAGRLHPQKDPLLLIEAMAALDRPNAHLLVIGDGDLNEAVRDRVQQHGLEKQVSMLGRQKPTAIARYLQVSDACVLTSLYEGMPVVVLEALACGTPIVTTRSGETPLLLTPNTGAVCDERSPGAIAEALRKVLHDPEFYYDACAQLSQPFAAQRVVSEVYDDMLQRWQQRLLVTV